MHREGSDRPPFVVVEGTAGVGKSTVVASLAGRLGATSLHFHPAFLRLRLDAGLDLDMAPDARRLYYYAGLVHLSHLVREALLVSPVISDRYLPSILAVLMADRSTPPDEVLGTLRPFEPSLQRPDLVLVLTADAGVAARRLEERLAREGYLSPDSMRCMADRGFYERTQQVILEEARARWPTVVLDTSAMDLEAMTRSAHRLVADRLADVDSQPSTG